jgi:major membrane immunogen (membrane-anchored lipoprotein)
MRDKDTKMLMEAYNEVHLDKALKEDYTQQELDLDHRDLTKAKPIAQKIAQGDAQAIDDLADMIIAGDKQEEVLVILAALKKQASTDQFVSGINKLSDTGFQKDPKFGDQTKKLAPLAKQHDEIRKGYRGF